MGILTSEEWLQAQNCLLGAALIDAELVPRVVTELTAEDFYGNCLLVYKAMADLFRKSKEPGDVDVIAVVNYLGNTPEARELVSELMGCSPEFTYIDRYFQTVRNTSKLLRLQSLGDTLATAKTMDEAISAADNIASQLMDRPGVKGFEVSDLMDSFEARHRKTTERSEWGLRVIGEYIRIKRGNFLILGAEPSGGKTAFALEQMWTFSRKHRVLFVSLETDEDTLFDRFVSRLTGIPMDALMDGLLTQQQWDLYNAARDEIRRRNFKILPGAGLSVAGIKAAAIGYRADIVIIDYLQIIKATNDRLSRYEAITGISMDLHIMAQSTGMIVIALSQVTNRDPQSSGKPLGIHSARESGQIEADADAILMLDKFVEKGLTESGCKANRILRIVKNKNGRCCNIPLVFDGSSQSFAKAHVPNPDWAKVQKEKVQKAKAEKKQQSSDEFAQLPMNTEIPF